MDYDLDFFLDDRPGNWESAARAGSFSVLYDERWNQDVSTRLRVHSLHEFLFNYVSRCVLVGG
jgi:hypothetical protein